MKSFDNVPPTIKSLNTVERHILSCMASGIISYEEIGQRLSRSPRTVARVTRNLMVKLQVPDLPHLVYFACRKISPDCRRLASRRPFYPGITLEDDKYRYTMDAVTSREEWTKLFVIAPVFYKDMITFFRFWLPSLFNDVFDEHIYSFIEGLCTLASETYYEIVDIERRFREPPQPNPSPVPVTVRYREGFLVASLQSPFDENNILAPDDFVLAASGILAFLERMQNDIPPSRILAIGHAAIRGIIYGSPPNEISHSEKVAGKIQEILAQKEKDYF